MTQQNTTPRTTAPAPRSRAFHMPDGNVYTVAASYERPENWHTSLFSMQQSWEADPAIVMGKPIVPYGHNNDLPGIIRKIMDENNIAPGIIERKIGLQFGDGPFLYREEITPEHQIRRVPVQDREITKWLESWDYRKFIDKAMVDYMHVKGHFVRFYRNRAPKVGGKGKIVKLDHISSAWARLGWPEHPEKRLENVTDMYVGDFENNCLHSGITRYPVFNPADPFKHRVSMGYFNTYSFSRQFYSVPSYFGTLKWLNTTSEIPDIIKYLTDNGITAAFHIHSPKGYWDEKRNALYEKYPDKPEAFIENRLQEYMDELYNSIALALAGKKNVGKFIATIDFHDPDGNLCAWKIEPIDQKIKDFIEAQVKVSDKADSAATSGMGLNPALANIVSAGSFSGGSQLLYAMKFHVHTDVNIPEYTIFEPINHAIRANWPDRDIHIGFYRKIIMKEDEVTPSARTTENV